MFLLIDTQFKFEMAALPSVSPLSILITPILLYGSEILGSLSTHQLVINNDAT